MLIDMRVFFVILILAAATPLSTLSSQQHPPLETGDRVRIRSHEFGLNMREGFVHFDSVLVVGSSRGNRLAIPLMSVNKLEVHRGTRNQIGKGALYGLGIGAGLGALWGLGMSTQQCSMICFTPAESAAIGAVVTGIPGLLIGVVAGALSKTDRWELIPLDRMRLSSTPLNDGTYAYGMSVNF